MFIERITLPRAEFERWDERLRIVSDPPDRLVASIAWQADDMVTAINVWEAPDAVADFFIERVHPVVEAHGPPSSTPERLGPAVRTFFRPAT